jgi:hypothetical protein
MGCFIIGITRSRPGGCELFDFRVRFWFGVMAAFVFFTSLILWLQQEFVAEVMNICSSDRFV